MWKTTWILRLRYVSAVLLVKLEDQISHEVETDASNPETSVEFEEWLRIREALKVINLELYLVKQ